MESRTPKKIAIIGAESTGKTLLCEALAKKWNTVWVPEYAREYFNQSDIYNYSLQDLEHIAQKQVEWEFEKMKHANQFLFCDTALITLKIWAELEFGTCPESMLKLMTKNQYDFYLITNNDVVWEKDAQRQNKFSREFIFERNCAAVIQDNKSFGIAKGLAEERVASAEDCLQSYLKGNII